MTAPTHTFVGKGLFSAAPATLSVTPTSSGGVLFARTGDQSSTTPARTEHLASASPFFPKGVPARNTTLQGSGGTISTVEHILSALSGLGIADAHLALEGPEVPMLDASALPFARALAPSSPGPGALAPVRPKSELVVGDAVRGPFIRVTPRSRPGLSVVYRYRAWGGSGGGGGVEVAWEGDPKDYLENIAPARTFCPRPEAEAMREAGMFGHINPVDVLVLDEQDRPVGNSFRLKDEPARHKLLDLIGDLSLAGFPLAALNADIVADRSGHALAHGMARELARGLRAARI